MSEDISISPVREPTSSISEMTKEDILPLSAKLPSQNSVKASRNVKKKKKRLSQFFKPSPLALEENVGGESSSSSTVKSLRGGRGKTLDESVRIPSVTTPTRVKSRREEVEQSLRGVKRSDIFIKPRSKVRKKITSPFKSWSHDRKMDSSSELLNDRMGGVKRGDAFIKPPKKNRKKMNPFKTWRI